MWWRNPRVRWFALLLCWVVLLAVVLRRVQQRLQESPATPRSHARHPILLHTPTHKTANASPTSPAWPATDTRVYSIKELHAEVERRLPSLPLTFWHKHEHDTNKFFEKKDCAPFPCIYDLEFHNTYWQTLRTSNGTFHVYGAYMDVRKTSRMGPAVRILAVHDRIQPNNTIQCQLWFEDRGPPVIVRTLEYSYLWFDAWGNYKDGIWQPYLLTCVLPPEVRNLVPASVSLVENACDRATNNLRVHYDRPAPPLQRKGFAVCVKGLDFLHEDLSVRLVEWIELIRLLGADKIFFYELQVHPNITKVLDYYTQQGAVTVTPVTLPGGQPNLPGLQHMYLKNRIIYKRQMELIPYNDCLYRHMYEYRWLALLDIDEVIVPMEDANWVGLMQRVLPLSKLPAGKPPQASYFATNLYFLDSLNKQVRAEGIPRYMHMLQNVVRTRNFTERKIHVKAFHETDHVLKLHNHYPMECLYGYCNNYELETRHARLQHYRDGCVNSLSNICAELQANSVRDETLWRWREPLVARVDHVLRALGFLPPHR